MPGILLKRACRNINPFKYHYVQYLVLQIIMCFYSTIRFNFVGADIRGTRLEQDCPALPDCPVDDKYRTFDGSCNNLQNTEWGKANTDVQR